MVVCGACAIGGSVSKVFAPDECTHLVWSYGNEKQLKVAELYDIKAVTPLWVQQCQAVTVAFWSFPSPHQTCTMLLTTRNI